jgi:ElaB/YqjD/DUF883 family membrane-anchored ribosome-binding protein
MATTTSPNATTENTGDDSMTAMQKLREQADAAVQRIQPQIAAVSTFARNEPTKALLISAAAGAALMGLFALIVRSSGRSPMAAGASALAAGASAMAAIRDAALDLADSAQSMAADALESTQKRASAAADGVGKRASAAADSVSAAADSVSEAAADAWQKVREQAAPAIERVKPQIDAAAQYLKEDPARAALGLAAAGAVVAGLLALIQHSQDD